MVNESDKIKYYYSKYNHPLDLSDTARNLFDYADYTLYPQDYHAVYLTLNHNGDYDLYICSNKIELERTQMWDFIQIAQNSANGKCTPTVKLQEQRRTIRTKDSKRKSSVIYKNISEINSIVKTVLNKEINIIVRTNSGYKINIDPQKPYSLYISNEILNI